MYKVFTTVALLMFGSLLFAQNVLQQGDVEKFIKTWDPIKNELEALGQDYSQIKNPTMMKGYLALEEVKGVFTKHGWNNDYNIKVATIAGITGYLMASQKLAEMPAENRAQVEPIINSMKAQMLNGASEADIEQVSQHKSELVTMFDEMN